MKIKEKFENIENETVEIKMLYNILFDAIRYQEMEYGQLTSIEYLCEIINKRFSTLLDMFDDLNILLLSDELH